MIETEILECLRRIEAEVSSDKYESLGIWTIGGPQGTYSLKGPANTEAEYALYGVSATAACTLLIDQNQQGNALATNGSASYGGGGGNESNALEGTFISINAATSFLPVTALFWQPIGRGSAIYAHVGSLAGGQSAFALVAVRRLLNRIIPAPPRVQPHAHTQRQSNRAERILAAESPMVAAANEGRYVIPGGPPFNHVVTPTKDDYAAMSRGEAKPPTPAEILLAKMRGKSGVY